MRQYITICILTILTACSSNEKQNNISGTSTNVQTDNFSFDEQPAKTIMDFLKWYRDNENKIGEGLVNNANNKTYDSTKFYSVNFEATEKYLAELKSTGFISGKYINKWREYFKKCDRDFKDNPSNDGPPEGFEYDFIMLSQEWEDDLKNVEKAKIIFQSVSNDNALLKIHFTNGLKLNYELSKHADKWLIDDIEKGQ